MISIMLIHNSKSGVGLISLPPPFLPPTPLLPCPLLVLFFPFVSVTTISVRCTVGRKKKKFSPVQ